MYYCSSCGTAPRRERVNQIRLKSVKYSRHAHVRERAPFANNEQQCRCFYVLAEQLLGEGREQCLASRCCSCYTTRTKLRVNTHKAKLPRLRVESVDLHGRLIILCLLGLALEATCTAVGAAEHASTLKNVLPCHGTTWVIA